MRNVLIAAAVLAMCAITGVAGYTGIGMWNDAHNSEPPAAQQADPVVAAIQQMSERLDDKLTGLSMKLEHQAHTADLFTPLPPSKFVPKVVEAPKAPVAKAKQYTPPPAPPAEDEKPAPPAKKAAPRSNCSGSVQVAQAPNCPPTTYSYSYPAYTYTTPTYSANCSGGASYSYTQPQYNYSTPAYSYTQPQYTTAIQSAPRSTYTYQRRGLFGVTTRSYTNTGGTSYGYGGYGYGAGYCTPYGCYPR